MLEAPMLEGMVKMKAFVVRAIMSIPTIVADVLRFVDFAVYVMLHLGISVRSITMGGRSRNPALVGSRHIIPRLGMLRFSALPFGAPTFRVLRVDTRGPEQYPCAQQQQRLASHLYPPQLKPFR